MTSRKGTARFDDSGPVVARVLCAGCKKPVGRVVGTGDPDRVVLYAESESPLPVGLASKDRGRRPPLMREGRGRESDTSAPRWPKLRCDRCGDLTPPDGLATHLSGAQRKGRTATVHAHPATGL